ncbi:DUF2523 family protein [Roseateles sp. DB2]|uniref:DUF2523 family protein n=1 Tax=Roseateles sp. DB2 TaxID=3453717 RepID=UPI003EE88B6C
MFGIFLSALNSILGWAFRTLVIKFVLFTALYLAVYELVSVMASWLPTGASLSSAFAGIGAGTWYFLDLFAVSVGVPMMVSAFLTRFIIRRIPVIG